MNFVNVIRAERNQALSYSLVVGTAVFIYVTGGAIINPTNRDWLMFGDAAQHYLGWEFFRHTPLLQWPIGANYPLGMELSSSIVFTDSIPIAAYIAKLFNPILPATFQYLGIWIWLCFVLQAFFAQRFLKFFLSNKAHVYLGACFVVLSPPLIYRLVHAGYGHIALASHWLILASFCLYLRPGRNDLRWSLLIALCWLIQAYFAPMVAAIWLASLAKRLYKDREKFALLKSVSVVAITSFIVMWASGYFMIGSNFNPEGWNYVFRWEPLSFIDSGTDSSTGWSRILQDRAQSAGATEAFSFLGVGVIAMMAIAYCGKSDIKLLQVPRIRLFAAALALFVGFLFVNPLSVSKVLSLLALILVVFLGIVVLFQLLQSRRGVGFLAPLAIAAISLATYSLTNSVGFGQRTLFEFPLFTPLRQFTETFRTHGRSIWPLFYLVQLAAVITFTKSIAKKFLTTILCALLCLQIYDSSSAISSARKRFTSAPLWSSPLTDPIWESSVPKYKYLVVIPPLNNDPEGNWIAIADFASKHKLATNSGYFSRFDQNTYQLITDGYLEQIKRNQFNPETVYIIDQKLVPSNLHNDLRINDELEEPNGYWVIFP